MMLIPIVAAFVLALQPPASPPQEKPAEQKAPAPKTALDELTPASQKVVKEHAKYFVVAPDGKWWDRQLWLKREELRDKMRRSSREDKNRTDQERALGVSRSAPVDPTSETGGIEIGGASWIESDRYNFHLGAAGMPQPQVVDATSPPLLRSVGEEMAITQRQIFRAFGDATTFRDAKPPRPEELAQALKDGKAELSEFRFTKKEVKRKDKNTTVIPGDRRHGFAPDPDTKVNKEILSYTEFTWFRNPVAVKWNPPPKPEKKPDGKP